MSFPTPSPSSQSASKRPRLSLQIKPPSAPQTLGKSATALKADIDPTSPTAFNTLSNAYAVAIENASPLTAKPPSSEPRAAGSAKSNPLRLRTSMVASDEYIHPSQRTQTPGPFSIAYPDTPVTSSTPATAHPEKQNRENPFTFTPPQSAGSTEAAAALPRIFTFAANLPNKSSPNSPRTPRRRATMTGGYQVAPYTHPRSLRSILRNSPLPPRSTVTPITPRTSTRLASRASKRVGYNDPLTQTITTNKYTSSHIDLLSEEEAQEAMVGVEGEVASLDATMAYTGDETRDGGQTPGPFEEMRRRMAGLEAESDPETPGARKRKRKEKKRKWVWTIGAGEDAEDGDPIVGTPSTPATALKVETPATAIWRGSSLSSVSSDSEMESIDERPTTSQSL
ncbi:hypothetical protein PVAG01_00685 [Phlyctema vagabunda]|uniref:Glucan 1,4-alpha-glucosidase n=1 Tax=Phlyctema vagabunda TaxID=108571 RepID=A0ABR4PWD7_9HELO